MSADVTALSSEFDVSSDEQFQQTLDKYYNEADQFELDLEQKAAEAKSMEFFNTTSSSYYQESQINLEEKLSHVENKISETLSDYSKYCSDLRFSDGFGGKPKFSTKEENENHTFNHYESYRSGYETTMDMPKAQVAQAIAIPLLVSASCTYFLFQNLYKSSSKK